MYSSQIRSNSSVPERACLRGYISASVAVNLGTEIDVHEAKGIP